MHATHNGRGQVFVLRISSCNNVRNPLPLLSLLQPPTYLPLRLLVDPTTYHAVRRVVMHLISCQPYLLRGGVAIKKERTSTYFKPRANHVVTIVNTTTILYSQLSCRLIGRKKIETYFEESLAGIQMHTHTHSSSVHTHTHIALLSP